MIDKIQTITTKHEGMIHDVQYDYYGQHMASCSSDGTVRVCTVHKPETPGHESVTEIASWQAHNGPVWQIGWAHPKFGRILASCGFDKKVIIWTETNQRDWREVITFETETSINAISFAPWECGLKLLACGIDGSMYYISRKNNDEWEHPFKFQAHSMSVNSVSWGALNNGLEYIVEEYLDKYAPLPKFATASCDKSVKVWEFQHDHPNRFVEVACLTDPSVHTDYIRDVAWCPKTGPNQVLASCSEDGYVVFWSNSKAGQNDFHKVTHKKCEGSAWRLSWSPEGQLLAVSILGSSSENIIELYKENGPNSWNKTTKLEDY